MVVGINGSIGQYNGILNGKVQYPAVQGYSYQPQTVNFQGIPQQTEEETKKKSSAVKKGIIGTVIGVAVATAALYAGVKTGKLTKVENASKWTEKLQNLAFEGGNYVKKGVDWAGTKLTSLKPTKAEKQFTDQEASILKRVAEGIKNDVLNGNIDPACWSDLL